MIMQKINTKYTWLNPYTGITKTGVVTSVDQKNEIMTVKHNNEIYHIGS